MGNRRVAFAHCGSLYYRLPQPLLKLKIKYKVENQIIESSSKTFSNILNAIKEKKQDKKNESKPTGNRVKDVHERLKKKDSKKLVKLVAMRNGKKETKLLPFLTMVQATKFLSVH